MTDAQYIAAQRAAERARDAAERDAYEAACIASWGDNPRAVMTQQFPPAMVR